MSARRRALMGLGVGVLFSALGLDVRSANGQTPIVRPARLPEPGRSIVASDDSTAVRVNPANLAFAPGSELRWTGIFTEESLAVPLQGNAVALSGRIPFINVPMGMRADFVDPPDGSGLLVNPNYQWLTFAIAAGAGPGAALGISAQTSLSEGAFANDLTSLSIGYTHRPFNFLGWSFVGHDLNAPSNGFSRLGRSYELGALLRPLGNRSVELGLESSYLEDSDTWIPRVTLGADLFIGTFRGDFSMSDPTDSEERAWLASAGFAVHINGMGGSGELAAGVITGDGLGQQDSYNYYGSVATRNFRQPAGIEPARYGLRLRLEDTPNPRQHVAFLRQLWSIAKEPNVDVVVFELRADPGGSLAALEELRDAVFELRRAGKRTLCHIEDGSGGALYFCAATNRTLINPAGSLRFSGMRSRNLYFSRVLDNIGVKAEFVRIGPHKTAPEQFSRTGATDVARADKTDLIQQFERGFVEGVAVGRNMSVAQVRTTIAQGPFSASEAKQHGLADQLAFDDQINKAAQQLTGRETPILRDQRARIAPETFGRNDYVALIHVGGDIVDGRNRTVPLLGMGVTGSYTIAETLKAVRENSQIQAVVIRVDSPGGSSMAADVIWRQVLLTAKAKPTVVSMGSVAASGGYYLAAPATRIFANPMTVTGSIGIFYLKVDISELLKKVGVDVEVYKTGERADAESIFRSFTAEERAELKEKITEFYNLFLQRVADGRKMERAKVDEVAQGRVWTGEQAFERGLVDELGGLRQALAYARQKAGLPDDAPIVELPVLRTSLLSRLLGLPGIHAEGEPAPEGMVPSESDLAPDMYQQLPTALSPVLKAALPLLVHDPVRPLARLEFDYQALP